MAEDIQKRRERQRRYESKRREANAILSVRLPSSMLAEGVGPAVRSLLLTLEFLRLNEPLGVGENRKTLVQKIVKLDEMMGKLRRKSDGEFDKRTSG
jgi:hypothetical protein